MPRLNNHRILARGVQYVFWPSLLREIRKREGEESFYVACEVNLLVLDEIKGHHDPSGFAKDTLYELINRRIGRWTVITSNLTMSGLEAIDARIASRLTRTPNVIVECNTKPYAKRQQEEPKLC